jgi:hypothetical protein
MPLVSELVFDETNVEKLDRHRLTPRQLLEAIRQPFVVVRNRKGGTATHLLIGRDRGGRCIACPIGPTTESHVWRPIAAWYCKGSEEAVLRDRCRRNLGRGDEMNEVDEDEPRHDEEWDFEGAQVVVPTAAPGAVVAVRFTADEFDLVAHRSETEGTTVIEYVRRAVLERARATPTAVAPRRSAD